MLLLASCELTEGGKGLSGGNKKIQDVTGSSSSLLFDYFEDDIYLEEARAGYYYRPSPHMHSGIVAILLPITCITNCTNKIIKMLPKDN